MKLHPVLALLPALIFVASVRADYSFKEPFSQSGTFDANGTVKLANVNGSVEIRAWDKNEIRIEGEKSAKTAEELKMIQLTIDQTPGRAVIKVKLPRRHSGWFGGGEIRAEVRLTICVPATARLDDVSTVNGSVTINGVQGHMEASSVNGHVKAIGAGGNVELSTVNGGVEALITSLPAGSRVKASSVNGGITLTLPQDVGTTIKASSVNGGIHCDFPLNISGHLTGRSLNGVIGAGGSNVEVSTVNGGISIRRP